MSDERDDYPEDQDRVAVTWPYRYHELAGLLDRAKAMPDGVVVLEGDCGGTTYVVARATRVKLSGPGLVQLLLIMDSIIWPKDDPSRSTTIWIDQQSTGTYIDGHLGAEGYVTDGIWVHTRFEELGIADEIREMIEGERGTIEHLFVEAFVILRHDQWMVDRLGKPATETVRAIKVVRSRGDAEREVERLNGLGMPGVVYFWSKGYASPGLTTVRLKSGPPSWA